MFEVTLENIEWPQYNLLSQMKMTRCYAFSPWTLFLALHKRGKKKYIPHSSGAFFITVETWKKKLIPFWVNAKISSLEDCMTRPSSRLLACFSLVRFLTLPSKLPLLLWFFYQEHACQLVLAEMQPQATQYISKSCHPSINHLSIYNFGSLWPFLLINKLNQ